MPSARVFAGIGIATLLLAVAAVAPGFATAALALDAALLLAFALDLWRAGRAQVSAARDWPPLLVQGSRVEILVRVEAARRLELVLRESLHPGLAQGPVRERLLALPGATALWRYAIVPPRRGTHRAGPLSARVLGPWGLAWSQRELLRPEDRRVYPQVRWEGQVGRLLRLAQRRELGQSPLRRRGLGSEPYALREYLAGDPLSRIHWKATARHGRLISREDAWERGARLLVLLDCARAMASADASRSKLDHALAAALALTRVAVSRGDRVTLVAFSDRIERLVRVRSGASAVPRAYARLFDLEARLAEPAYDLAAEAARSAEPRRAAVVLLTSVVDLAAAELLREALLSLGRRPTLLVNLQDPDVVRLAYGSPASPPEAFAKVSSLEVLLANRRLARQLRRVGIRLVSSAADQLAWETLGGYLRLVR